MIGVICAVLGFCIFMLGGKIRVCFLYLMFTLCAAMFAQTVADARYVDILIWIGSMSLYAVAVAQESRSPSVGKVGKAWWMVRYAAHMRDRTINCSWAFCWVAAQCAIDNDDYWREWSPIDACDEELSCWSE